MCSLDWRQRTANPLQCYGEKKNPSAPVEFIAAQGQVAVCGRISEQRIAGRSGKRK